MGLFDIFSNDKAEEAAAQRNAGLQQGYETLSGLYGQGREAINTGATKAQGYYAPLISKYGQGSNAYGDASGANGVEGLQRGTEAFKNSGQYGVYGVNLGEGLQALQRTHAAAGNLNSGNADADTLKYATDQATKAYGSYLSGLQPYLGMEGNAAAGAAGVATGQGGALNQSFQGQGNAANANYTGQGASNAAATMNEYNISKNMWDGIGKAFGTATSLFGGFG
jgi:hypothetical protein